MRNNILSIEIFFFIQIEILENSDHREKLRKMNVYMVE